MSQQHSVFCILGPSTVSSQQSAVSSRQSAVSNTLYSVFWAPLQSAASSQQSTALCILYSWPLQSQQPTMMRATLLYQLYLLPAVLGCRRASLKDSEHMSDPATASPGGLRDRTQRAEELLVEEALLAERAGLPALVPDLLDEVLVISQGLPSSLASLGSGDLGLESIRTLTSTGNSLLRLINIVREETVGDHLRKLDSLLETVNQKTIILNANHTSFAAKNIGLFVDAKVKLQVSRNILNVLARRTVTAVAEVKEYTAAIFGGKLEEDVLQYYVKEQTKTMRELARDTNKEIDAINRIYKEVGGTFGEIKANVKTYQSILMAFKLNETLIIQDAERTTTITRAATYSILATSQVACIFVDIFLTFGLCSGISAAVFLSTAVTTETVLATVLPGLPQALHTAEQILEDLEEILAQNEGFQTYLAQESLAVRRWEVALESVEGKLEAKTSQIYLSARFQVERRNLERALQNLDTAAQGYLDQPELL